jgi:hypothetical protein
VYADVVIYDDVMWNVCLFLLLVMGVYLNVDATVATLSRQEIVIAGLFPTAEDIKEGEIGRGVRPAVELALERVNNDSRILTDYELKLTWNDTRVSYEMFYLLHFITAISTFGFGFCLCI